MLGHFTRPIARPAFFFACLGIMASCTPMPVVSPVATASIGLDYASTSLGFRNSGALGVGRLMLWDQETGELVDLDSAIPLQVASTSTPANLAATNVSGITVSANVQLASADLAEIGTSVSRDLTIEAKDAVRDTTINELTALSDAYRRHFDASEDVFRTWRVADAAGNPGRYKYVLLVDPVRASSETVQFSSTTSASANVTIVDTVQGKLSVKVPNNASASCSQVNRERALCFVNAKVLQVYLNASGRLDYQPVAYSRAALAEAFRKQ